MSPAEQRLVSFAGSTVAVQYRGERPRTIVDFLYRHAPGPSGGPPQVTFRLTADRRSDQLFLYRDGELFYRNTSDGAVAEILLGDSCHHLAKESRGGLLFHAAALAWEGHGVLLPGGMGAGKTTLAAWLTARGLHYLTDELAFLPHGADRMQAFTRPLNLKHPSIQALERHIDFAGMAESILCNAHSCLVPHRLIGSGDAPAQVPLSLILFPQYAADIEPALHSLSRGQTGLSLMGCLVNARNLSGHGFQEIVGLARLAPAFRLCYSSFEQIEAQLEELLQPIRSHAPS
jgi:hypothetical protein